MSQGIAWDEVLKKEESGINNFNLGEVQQVGTEVIVT
jgi:hypothetical protein